MNSYNGKINTNFRNDKMPKDGSQFICLSVILIDSVFRIDKNYYSQVVSEECKYVVKGKKIPVIFFLIVIEKILMKKILIKKILMKKI